MVILLLFMLLSSACHDIFGDVFSVLHLQKDEGHLEIHACY